ncbi:MAG: extracellular solute-binding protein [Lachnospiraceae bacterium]|nr:extracellular solute-binding protein [Lachnospiraceae bacterium]
MKIPWKKPLIALLALMFLAQCIHSALENRPVEPELVEEQPILVWYTDPELQEYMETTAAEAEEAYGIEVNTGLVSEVDYIETIGERSMAEEMTGPDLYVASSSQLEKAYLAGLASRLDDDGIAEEYSEKAAHAVTYDGETVALPFYIETCFLLYNRYYTEEAPATIDDILTYAEAFESDDVTSLVENIFAWNVADVIDNYMFLGAYTELGGEDGDDKEQVSLDLEKIEECLSYYQSLNEYFAIDADTVTSDDVIQDFIDGRTVFVIANVAMLAQLDQAVDAGELPEYPTERTVTDENGEETTEELSYEPFYAAAALPDLSSELASRGLSVTNSIVVNPYSANTEMAEAVARYFTEDKADELYSMVGKLPAYRNLAEDPTPAWEAVCTAYDAAAETPKIIELSDMWLNLEATLADIWRGEDAGDEIAEFAGLLESRLD